MLISAIFHTDDRGVWTYVSMNDDYYRRRIGPVNILTFVSGRALVDYIIGGFSRHWEEGRAASADGRRRRQQWERTRTTFFLLPPTWLGARSLELEKATGSFITNTLQTFVLIIFYFPSSKFPPNLYTPMATKVAQKRVSTAFYTRRKTFPAIRQC